MCGGLGLQAVISVKTGTYSANKAKCYYLSNLSGRMYTTRYVTNFALCLFERVGLLEMLGTRAGGGDEVP